MNLERVLQAIHMRLPNYKMDNCSRDSILNMFGIFSWKSIEYFASCSPTEIEKIIDRTAELILSVVIGENLDSPETAIKIETAINTARENHGYVKYNKVCEKVYSTIKSEFPNIIESSETFEKQYHLLNHFVSRFNTSSRHITEGISAKIKTTDEANAIKVKIEQTISELKQEIQQSELQDSLILDEKFETLRTDSNALVDKKLTETPVLTCYYRAGNHIAIKLNFNKPTNSYSFNYGRGREVHWNKGEDRKEYPLIISKSYIEDFLCCNKVEVKDVEIAPESLKEFYSFDAYNSSITSSKLTNSFVDKWWNYDCPDLYRHEINADNNCNLAGFVPIHFSTKLIESSFDTDYIEDITENEFKRLTKGREETRLYQSIRNYLDSVELKESEDKSKVNQLSEDVKAYDLTIQKVIDDNSLEILQSMADSFKGRVKEFICDTQNLKLILDDNFGFDCGFLNIFSTDNEYKKKREILRNLDNSFFPWMNLNMPYNSQSLTIMRKQFSIVKDVINRKLGINLYASTQLD